MLVLQIGLGVCLGMWFFRIALRLPWRRLGVVSLLAVSALAILWTLIAGYRELFFWEMFVVFIVGEALRGRFSPDPAPTATTELDASDPQPH